ncbi:MAG: hypothetical protein ACI8RZ_002001 [Myxococcota bacterium]|jgi:hypothetical protein
MGQGHEQHQTAVTETTPATASSPSCHTQRRGNAFAQEQLRGQAPEPGVGAQRVGAPTSKRRALAQHGRNQARIDRIIRSGLAQQVDPSAGANSRVSLLRNTCQWIDAGEANLFVLTPTHDAHLRPSCPADKNAYFDSRTTYDQAGANYNDALDAAGQATDDAGLAFKFSNVAGSMGLDGVTMTLVDPVSFSEGDLVSFFTHEVQHDADQHNGGAWQVPQPAADPAAQTRAPQWAYNQYQSEFRAYWMMNPEGSSADTFGSSTDLTVNNIAITAIHAGPDGVVGSVDDVTAVVNTVFSNRRQQDIFNYMFGGGRADNTYLDATGSWTRPYAYLPHYYALDPAFKAMIDSYTVPAAGNLINSPRIQALSEAVAAGSFFAELDALDDLDIGYLRDRVASQPFWTQVDADLMFMQRVLIENHIDNTGSPVGPYQETVTVVAGDTLSAIADRYLNDTRRWRELYALNQDTVGNDPGHIVADQVLRMPAL